MNLLAGLLLVFVNESLNQILAADVVEFLIQHARGFDIDQHNNSNARKFYDTYRLHDSAAFISNY